MTADWHGPFWLQPFFADSNNTIFHRVTGVELRAREVPSALLQLRHLESVRLFRCKVSTEQVRGLNSLRTLKSLGMDETYTFNEADVQAFQPGDSLTLPFATEEDAVSTWTLVCQSGSPDAVLACPTVSVDVP